MTKERKNKQKKLERKKEKVKIKHKRKKEEQNSWGKKRHNPEKASIMALVNPAVNWGDIIFGVAQHCLFVK
jgi:hypothetical protein